MQQDNCQLHDIMYMLRAGGVRDMQPQQVAPAGVTPAARATRVRNIIAIPLDDSMLYLPAARETLKPCLTGMMSVQTFVSTVLMSIMSIKQCLFRLLWQFCVVQLWYKLNGNYEKGLFNIHYDDMSPNCKCRGALIYL
jgi:hypothetical protein